MMNAPIPIAALFRLDQSDARQAGCLRNCKVCTGTSGRVPASTMCRNWEPRTPGPRTRGIIWLPDPASSSAGRTAGLYQGEDSPARDRQGREAIGRTRVIPHTPFMGDRTTLLAGSVRSNSRHP